MNTALGRTMGSTWPGTSGLTPALGGTLSSDELLGLGSGGAGAAGGPGQRDVLTSDGWFSGLVDLWGEGGDGASA